MVMIMINWFGDGNGYVGNIDFKLEVVYIFLVIVDWYVFDKEGNELCWFFKLILYFSYVENYIDVDVIGCFNFYSVSIVFGVLL